MGKERTILLVGDNPFHGISHLSQDRRRARGVAINEIEFDAQLVMKSLENGADGFMFSVSDTTLSILEAIRKGGGSKSLKLYAIAPYAYEYVRLATQVGGVSGLLKTMVKQIVLSMNVRAIVIGLKGLIWSDLTAIMETYLLYEISRIRSAAGKMMSLDSILLHEVITDMALSLDLEWFFKSYTEFMLKLGMRPGFETRNFAYLVSKFEDWGFDFSEIIVATPFNRVGFQMNPSKTACEKALANVEASSIIVMSIFAAGYLKPSEAIDYIASLPNLKGVVAGVSQEHQATETFQLLRNRFKE